MRLGALHPCLHATVTLSPWEGGTRQYIGCIWEQVSARINDLMTMYQIFLMIGLCGIWNGDSSDDRNGDDRQHPNDFIESFR